MISVSWPASDESRAGRLRAADLQALRAATVRGDRQAVSALLVGHHPGTLLQHVGDALLAVGVDGMEDAAREVERLLRERDQEGDVELADALAGRLGAPVPMLRPVRADLDQVADLMTTDPHYGSGGWLDLSTGDGWPASVLENMDSDERPDIDEEPERWIFIPGESSHTGWSDRRDFVEGMRAGELRDSLLVALEGRGAFGGFSRALDDEPELLTQWRAFEVERGRGRARSLLAVEGYTPLPSTVAERPRT